MAQEMWDAWTDVRRAAEERRPHGAQRLRKALEVMQVVALDTLIENAIWRDDQQTTAEVEACAHPRGRDGCPGDRLTHGCHNHRAHDWWAYHQNQAMYAAADARKARQKENH
jgi:hypothetical protein